MDWGLNLVDRGSLPAYLRRKRIEKRDVTSGIRTRHQRFFYDHRFPFYGRAGSNTTPARGIRPADLLLPFHRLATTAACYSAKRGFFEKERPHAPKKSQYERKDFDTWIDYAVLPFIDLTLWELVSGMKVPRRVMALALSDSGIISEKKIEQTIEPLAIRFLNQWAGFGNKPNQTDPLIILRGQAGLKLDR